jgi:hypothetical protein
LATAKARFEFLASVPVDVIYAAVPQALNKAVKAALCGPPWFLRCISPVPRSKKPPRQHPDFDGVRNARGTETGWTPARI